MTVPGSGTLPQGEFAGIGIQRCVPGAGCFKCVGPVLVPTDIQDMRTSRFARHCICATESEAIVP